MTAESNPQCNISIHVTIPTVFLFSALRAIVSCHFSFDLHHMLPSKISCTETSDRAHELCLQISMPAIATKRLQCRELWTKSELNFLQFYQSNLETHVFSEIKQILDFTNFPLVIGVKPSIRMLDLRYHVPARRTTNTSGKQTICLNPWGIFCRNKPPIDRETKFHGNFSESK